MQPPNFVNSGQPWKKFFRLRFGGLSVIFQNFLSFLKFFSQKCWILTLERANKGFGGRRHPAAAYPFEAVLRPGGGFKESRSKRWVLSFSLAAIPLLIFRPTRPLVAALVFHILLFASFSCGSDPADVVRDVGKFFVSESFRVCLRRTRERARNIVC